MPYSIKKDSRCGASKPFGVVKKSDGKLMGCHISKKKARAQIAALEISEKKEQGRMEEKEKGLEEELYVTPDGDVYVDYDILTFAQLEQQVEAKEAMKEIEEVTKAFHAIVNNILGHSDITDKASAISQVATEYQARIDSITTGTKEETKESKGIFAQIKEYFDPIVNAIKGKDEPIKTGIKTFEAPDGETWIIVWSTNAFMDREGEIFTTKALDDLLERQAEKDVKGEFWFWHVPGTKYADIKLQARVGRFIVEAGPFDHTEIGQGFKDFFIQYPDGHPIIAPNGWGASHGYRYNKKDREDSVYEWFDKHESTVLPTEVASNPYNPQMTTNSKEAVLMDEKTRKEWEGVFGEKLVSQIVKTGEQRTAELEAANVAFKGEAVDEKEDGSLQTALLAIAESMPESDEKAMLVAMAESDDDISEQLKSLAEKVSGDAGLKLLSLVETLPKAEKETEEPAQEEPTEEPQAEEKAQEEPQAEEKEPEEETPEYVTRTELKEVAEMLVEQISTLVNQAVMDTKEYSSKELEEAVNGITEILAGVAGKVKELSESDETRIASKTMDTPAASLVEMLQGTLFGEKTRVDGRTALAKDGPDEADTKDGPQINGIPFKLW